MSFLRIFRPAPRAVQDELALLLYGRMVVLVPFLYIGIAATAITVGVLADSGLPFILAFGLPGLILGFSFARMIVWMRRKTAQVTAAHAACRLNGLTKMTVLITLIAAIWAVWSWYTTTMTDRISIPIFLALAALATTNCLIGLRLAALATLTICILPMVGVLLTSGEATHFALGICLGIITALQVRMIVQQHRQIVDSLVLQRKMRRLANQDMLTGMPNRRAFFEQVEEHLSNTDDCVVALLDLDGFKPINDNLGHFAGDQLLVEISTRLRRQSDDTMLVARLGGDEFAILFRGVGDVDIASAKATGILAALALPSVINGHTVSVTASIGLARFPRDGATATELLTAADAALYAAKAHGRARFEVASTAPYEAKAA